MEALAVLALKVAILTAIGFVAAVVLRMREPFLGYLGAGYLGWKLGEWAGEQFNIHDPTEIRIRAQETPILLSLAGALLVTLVVRLLRRRNPARA